MYGPSEYSLAMKWLRALFRVLDKAVYMLISGIYQVFYNIADSTLLSGDTIKQIFSRVQLILGIFILFRVAIVLVNGILNPKSFTDEKTGFGGILKRVVISLLLLAMIIPLNIPQEAAKDDSFESRLNDNGILFGTLYEFQNRILKQQTISQLILGKSMERGDETNKTLADAGKRVAVVVLKTFITVNLKSEDIEDKINSEDDYVDNDDYRMCSSSTAKDQAKEYNSANNINTLLKLTKSRCDNDKDYFTFNYSFLISTVVGALFVIIMVGFTLDIAIRAFKLAILRIIAPVPIIAYIDPKKGDNYLTEWSKALTTTYLDLFIRLAVIFFIIFIIDEFITNGFPIANPHGAVGLFSILFIILGLFYFAKEAPKFIVESMGFKYNGGMFKGIGKVFAPIGAGLTGGISGAVSSFRASKAASLENSKEDKHQTWNPLKAALAGAAGGISGATKAGYDAGTAKEKRFETAMNKAKNRNAELLASGEEGGTWWGRTKNSFSSALIGDTEYDKAKREETKYKRQLEDEKGIQTTSKTSMDFFKTEAAKTGKGAIGQIDIQDKDGNAITTNMALDQWNSAIESAKARGDNNITIQTTEGDKTITLQQAFLAQTNMEESAAQSHIINEITKAQAAGEDIRTTAVYRYLENYATATNQKVEDLLGASDSYAQMKKTYIEQFGKINDAQKRLDQAQKVIPKSQANSRQAKK